MKTETKQITIYIANDNKEFSTENECLKWEIHLRLDQFHKNLLLCNFHPRCKIIPYYHNRDISAIGNEYTDKNLSPNNSYLLMGGRMGNGDDRVRYKLHGSTITLLRYSTDDNEQKFICSLPTKWMDLSLDDLQIEVDKFVGERKVFRPIVSYTQTITYVEVK